MSKFDRCIFISIAVGIWALAMTQIFKPEILQAGYSGQAASEFNSVQQTAVVGDCPNDIEITPMQNKTTKVKHCYFLLTASYDDLLKHPEYFQ